MWANARAAQHLDAVDLQKWRCEMPVRQTRPGTRLLQECYLNNNETVKEVIKPSEVGNLY